MRRLARWGGLTIACLLAAFASGTLTTAHADSGSEQSAVAWAQPYANDHDTSYNYQCLKFVFDAYQHGAGVNLRPWVDYNIDSNTYPVDIWNHFTHGTTGTDTPPYGALVFWAASNGDRTASHVALSTGDGNVISTAYGASTKFTHYATMSDFPGATFLGWWLPDGSSTPPPGGQFVQTPDGKAWQIVGNAPLYVDSWDPYGGVQPMTSVSNLDAYWQYPADGTFVTAKPSNTAWVFVGGAPLRVDNWSIYGGAPSMPTINDGDLADYDQLSYGHVRQFPLDGKFVTVQPDNTSWIFAGGAPLRVDNWTPYGGVQPSVTVNSGALGAYDQWSSGHVRQYPADGAAVWNATAGPEHGAGYVFAGGAPLYVTDWSRVGSPAATAVNGGALGAYSDWSSGHVRQYPSDATYLRGAPEGRVFRVQGHRAYFVAHPSAPVGNQAVTVDQTAIDRAGSAGDIWSHLSSGPPVVHMNGAKRRSSRRSDVRISWSAPVQSSAVTSFDIRVHRRLSGHHHGSWSRPGLLQHTHVTQMKLSMKRRTTYTVEVRARNFAGKVSKWSPGVVITRA